MRLKSLEEILVNITLLELHLAATYLIDGGFTPGNPTFLDELRVAPDLESDYSTFVTGVANTITEPEVMLGGYDGNNVGCGPIPLRQEDQQFARMNADRSCRPRDHLIAVGKRYPNAWKQVDEFRASQGQDDLPEWPPWCFLPLSGFYAIVSAAAGSDSVPMTSISDVALLGALGTWRVTQGIYKLDPDVYESVRDTPLTGNLPCDVFYRLPEWCVYIETPDVQTPWGRQYGAWVHLEWDVNTERTELRLLLDTDAGLHPIILHLGEWSITEALERANAEAARQAGIMGINPCPEQLAELKSVVEPIISLTLYLCSMNAEFGDDAPKRPKPKKTKRGWRLFPPDKPRTWDVAVRLGSEIRKYHHAERTGRAGSHASPRPHIRRAHWHSFWTGSKKNHDKRRIVVKWMPPIPVNIDDNELPATVRPVK